MTPELIIDGYNLLHLAGLVPRKSAAGALEKAREKLLKRLGQGLLPEERTRTTVVFDAQYAEHKDRQPGQVHGMTVLFSPRGRQADDLIEELLLHHPESRQLVVISSDHRIQRAARAARAGIMDCDSFLVELDRRRDEALSAEKPELPERTEPTRGPTESASEDLEGWLAEFKGIEVDELRREVQFEAKPALSEHAAPKTPQPTVPPKESPSAMRPSLRSADRKVPGPPSTPGNLESTASPEADATIEAELSFWEQRVAELFEEDRNKKRRP